jgi:hypothetical protein
MTKQTSYFVVPKPGHYGDRAAVVSSHRTATAAKRAAGAGYEVRVGAKRRGDVWLRAHCDTYPLADVGGHVEIEG